jgi:hypothetical protein
MKTKNYMKRIAKAALQKKILSTFAGPGTQKNHSGRPNGPIAAPPVPVVNHPFRMLVIRGPKNCGKTSSISNAFYRLINRFIPIGANGKHPLRGLKVEFFHYSNHPHKELTAIIEFNKNTNNQLFKGTHRPIKKLGIATRGDTVAQVQDTLDLFRNEGCDAVIIACRYTPNGNGQNIWNRVVLPHPLTKLALQLGTLRVFDFQAAPQGANFGAINHARGTRIVGWV